MIKHVLVCMIVMSSVFSVQCMEQEGVQIFNDAVIVAPADVPGTVDAYGNELKPLEGVSASEDQPAPVPAIQEAQSTAVVPGASKDSVTVVMPSALVRRSSPLHEQDITKQVKDLTRILGDIHEGYFNPHSPHHVVLVSHASSLWENVNKLFCCRRKK